MYNIGKNDVNYNVNEEKRTIVAYVEGIEDMFRNFVYKNYRPLKGSFLLYDPRLRMPNRFYAKAVCSKDDEWDVELGKRIAFDRLKDKINNSFFSRASYFVTEMDRHLEIFCEKVNNYGEGLTKCAEYRKNKISKELENK